MLNKFSPSFIINYDFGLPEMFSYKLFAIKNILRDLFINYWFFGFLSLKRGFYFLINFQSISK